MDIFCFSSHGTNFLPSLLDLERTEVCSVFLSLVVSRFGFWGQKGGSGGSRFGLKVRRTFRTFLNQENYLILTQFSVSLRDKILKVGFSSDGSNCKIRFDPTLVFLLKKVDPFSQKLFLKIFEHHKSHFFKNSKGSRFGLLRFGLVLKSKHRFGRFEVRFPEVREVRGSVISGSFQV